MQARDAAEPLTQTGFDLIEACEFQRALDVFTALNLAHGRKIDTGLAEVLCLSRLGRDEESSALFEALLSSIEEIKSEAARGELLALASTIRNHLPGGTRDPARVEALEQDAMKWLPRLAAKDESK